MSEILQEYKYLTDAETRVKKLDHAIEALDQDVDIRNKYFDKSKREWVLLEAKLKKERLVALTALTKSKKLLAEMQIYIAENELNYKCQERAKIVPRNPSAGTHHSTTSVIPSCSRRTRRSSSSSTNSTSIYSSKHSSRSGSLTSSSSGSTSSSKSSKNCASTSSSTRATPSKSKKANSVKSTIKYSTPYCRNNNHSSFSNKSVIENKENASHRDSFLSVVPLSNANANPGNLDINKSLTESVTAEFDKSSFKENLSLKRRVKKRKQLSTKIHLSYKSPVDTIRPSLHPGDPRTSPVCDKKERSITGTPRTLPILQDKLSKRVLTLKPSNENRQDYQHTLSSSEQVDTAPVFAAPDTETHISNINSLNVIEQSPIDIRFSLKHPQSVQSPIYVVPIKALTSQNYNIPQKVINSHNYLSGLSQNLGNISQQICRNKQQLAVGNRHICVPAPPTYNCSRNRIPVGNESGMCTPKTEFNSSYTRRNVPKVELSAKTKDLRTPNGPTKVCFYNSS